MTERADGERAVTILGKYGTTLVPIGVDGDGNLVAIIKGTAGGTTLHDVAVDTSGQLIMVPRGQSGNYLAVDSDGYMTTVIKGDYAGALRTVTLDDEGRLSAYIVDPEDVWGVQEQMGLSGLAACLGAAKRFDGRGTVLAIDTFERGLQRWVSNAASANSTIAISPTEVAHGGYSVALTAAGEISGGASIALELPYPVTSAIGIEFHVYLPAAFSTFSLLVYKYDGTNVHYGGLKYLPGTTRLQYRDSAGAWQDYRTGITLHGLTRVFGVWKLAVDFDNDLYIRSLVNNYYDDLDVYALRSTADASIARLRFVLALVGNDADEAIAYVDTVIVTQNEPANP